MTPLEFSEQTIPEVVADKIFEAADIDTLATFSDDPATEYWIEQLEYFLPPGDLVTQRILRTLWSTDDADACIQGMLPVSRVRHIASELVNLSDVRRILGLLTPIAAAPLVDGARLLDLMAPLWVPPAIADDLRTRAIAGVHRGPEIMLSADDDETGFEVVRRAFRCDPDYQWSKNAMPKHTLYLYFGTCGNSFSDMPDLLDDHILAAALQHDAPSDPAGRTQAVIKSAASLPREAKEVYIVPVRTAQYESLRDPLQSGRYPGIAVLVLRANAERFTPTPPLVAVTPDLTHAAEKGGRHYVDSLRSRLTPSR